MKTSHSPFATLTLHTLHTHPSYRSSSHLTPSHPHPHTSYTSHLTPSYFIHLTPHTLTPHTGVLSGTFSASRTSISTTAESFVSCETFPCVLWTCQASLSRTPLPAPSGDSPISSQRWDSSRGNLPVVVICWIVTCS